MHWCSSSQSRKLSLCFVINGNLGQLITNFPRGLIGYSAFQLLSRTRLNINSRMALQFYTKCSLLFIRTYQRSFQSYYWVSSRIRDTKKLLKVWHLNAQSHNFQKFNHSKLNMFEFFKNDTNPNKFKFVFFADNNSLTKSFTSSSPKSETIILKLVIWFYPVCISLLQYPLI